MQVRKYHNEAGHSAYSHMPCTDCYPIIYQVFFASPRIEQIDTEEAHWLSFDITNAQLLQMAKDFKEEEEKWNDIDEALSSTSFRGVICM